MLGIGRSRPRQGTHSWHKNRRVARAPLDGYDRRYAAFTNIDFQTPTDHFDGFLHFDALLADYGGRFILNTRPLERWLASVMRNAGRPRLRAAWEEHHRRVLAEVPAQSLLVFDIKSDPPERLCDFIGVGRERAHLYTLENPRMMPLAEALAARLPRSLRLAVPQRVRHRVKKALRRRP